MEGVMSEGVVDRRSNVGRCSGQKVQWMYGAMPEGERVDGQVATVKRGRWNVPLRINIHTTFLFTKSPQDPTRYLIGQSPQRRFVDLTGIGSEKNNMARGQR